jgi:hypothetical protein
VGVVVFVCFCIFVVQFYSTTFQQVTFINT